MIPKFRIYDKTQNKMYDVYEILYRSETIVVRDCSDLIYFNFLNINKRQFLMQYTNIFSKNGEVCEGDVVKQKMLIPTSEIEELTGVVKMLEGAWTIVNDKKKIACNLWREGAEMEILGNIWEGGE